MKIKRLIKYWLRKTKPIEWVTFVNKTDNLLVVHTSRQYVEVYPDELMYAHSDYTDGLIQKGLTISNDSDVFYKTTEEAEQNPDKIKYRVQ